MTIKELFENYEFHDSLLTKVNFDVDKKELIMDINLCNYEQKDFKEGDDENIDIAIKFSGCESYDGLLGVLDTHSILETILNNEKQITFNVMDDMSNDYYELSIHADFVEIITNTNA